MTAEVSLATCHSTTPAPSKKPSASRRELKRRHVYKVAVAYAVVAWLLIQVTGTVFAQLRRRD